MALDYEITAVRLEPSDDQSHTHVALIGYESLHTPGEPILIPPARALQKMALAEKFHIGSGEGARPVKEGKCPVCGYAPYLVVEGDAGDTQTLLTLPQS